MPDRWASKPLARAAGPCYGWGMATTLISLIGSFTTLSCASGEFIGHAFIGNAQPTTATSDNACHALLAACVEAARRLKAA